VAVEIACICAPGRPLFTSGNMPELTTTRSVTKQRPVWYNLSPVNLPVPGLVSIFHRVSGLALFVGVAWLLYLLDASLRSQESFDAFKVIASHPFAKLCLLVLAWAYLHHFCAGVRFLVQDTHRAETLHVARKTAGSVFIVSLLLTLVVAVKIW
jgi:succinate dehydrogenase / fumarate reductase cytochrome b subunit